MKNEGLEKTLAYIDAHICEKLTLPRLAGLAGYSPFYFSRLFSEVMGMPVTGYVRIRKLQYSVASLLEGKKVLEVSLMYGFESHEGYTRAFTQLFGSTPSTVKRHLTSYQVPAYVVPDKSPRRDFMENSNSNLQEHLQLLIYEILEQSLGEAREGHCTEIKILVRKDGTVQISDNGRGIPLSQDENEDQKILDRLLAGCPVSGLEYSRMGDFSALNLQTVNSLCESLQVCVYRNGTCFLQDYVRGIPQHKLRANPSKAECGMRITMKPDTTIFGDAVCSCDFLKEWMQGRLSALDPGDLNVSIEVCETF